MATDTARVELELASGKNESTAPFHLTAPRRRNKHEPDADSVDAPAEPPAAAQVIVDVPLAEAAPPNDSPPPPEPTIIDKQPGTARPPWIAFIAAVLVVAGAVWWVMFQRLPDIDPREVIARNLSDAQTAMADGRYTDPPERSALHYYSTVLALDPRNVDAIAGIDAIADRHLTNARVLLAEQRVAEAAVALEKARRVRPEHTGLPALDAQLRTEFRRILAVTGVAPKLPDAPPVGQPTAKVSNVSATRSTMTTAAAPRTREPAPQPAGATAADVTNKSPSLVSVADVGPVTAALTAASQPPAQPSDPSETNSAAVAESQSSRPNSPGAGANIGDAAAVVAAPSTPPEPTPAVVQSVELKLIKMVQPEYPQEALMRGIEGWVDVSLQVSAAGDVIAPRVEETSRGRMFNRAALAAVQQWKYEPRDGGTTSERVRVRLQFKQSN